MRPSPAFGQFTRALHWRYILARGLERIGMTLLISTACIAAILPVLWYENLAALPIALVILAMGVAVGVLAGCLHRPTRLAAIVEADRQLKTHDLLSTAYGLTDRDGPWTVTIQSLADAKCRQISANSVIFRRWGARWWGGVGLAVCLVMAVALVLNQPGPLVAADQRAVNVFASGQSQEPVAPRGNSGDRSPGRATPVKGAEEFDPPSLGSSREEVVPASITSTEQATPPSPGLSAISEAAGAGTSHTQARPSVTRVTDAQSSPERFEALTDRVQSGSAAGQPSSTASLTASSPTAGIAFSSAAPPLAPWSAHSAEEVARGWEKRTQTQPQLDAYSDLIRGYFSAK